jgi:hypothetical protein
MKVKYVEYVQKEKLAIELIAETTFETYILQRLWGGAVLSRGNGDSKTQSGMSTGFYIDLGETVDKEKKDETK